MEHFVTYKKMSVPYTLRKCLYTIIALCPPYKNCGVQHQTLNLKGSSQYCTLYSIMYIFILIIKKGGGRGISAPNMYSAPESCNCNVAYNFHGMLLGTLGDR